MMPRKGEELVDLDVSLVHETEFAFLVTVDGEKDIWIPKSQCELDLGTAKRSGTLTLPRWLAEDKGLV